MSSRAQREFLIGPESTPGTGVNATYQLRATGSFRAISDKVKVEEDIGSFAPTRHYIGSIMAEGSLEMNGFYQQAPYPVAMAMGTPLSVTGGPNYTWTFELPDDVTYDFQTFSVEYTDGADRIVRATDVFATSLEIAGEAGESWEITADMVGGEVTYPASTTGPTEALPTATTVRMADTELYIDDTYGNIGNTNVTVLISFNWKLENLQHQKLFAGSLYPTGRGWDKWETTLELVLECEDSDVETEVDKLLTSNLSAIRLRATNGSLQFDIDGMYLLDEVESLDDRDGNNTIKLTYKGQKDSSDNTGQVVIITTLPENNVIA